MTNAPAEVVVRSVAVLGFCLLTSVALPAQEKHALLIGIDQYAAPAPAHPVAVSSAEQSGRFATADRRDPWTSLTGAVADVGSMEQLLEGKFGFAQANVHVLANGAATNAAILQAMQTYLVDEPAAGDLVVFYYAGHGSQRTNSKTAKAGGLDNTIVGADANTGAFDVRDLEMAQIFNKAADKGIRVTAIYDSCDSGTVARGLATGRPPRVRALAYDPRDIHEARPADYIAPEDRKTNPVLVLSAAEADQPALEYDSKSAPPGDPLTDGAHGAFTYALIRALKELPPDTPARDVFERVAITLQGLGLWWPQNPFITRNAQRLDEPLFSQAGTKQAMRLAVIAVDTASHVVTLDSCLLNNIGPGSELTGVSSAVRLTVSAVDGPRHCSATANEPDAPVNIGDFFTLSKWMPPAAKSLAVWMPAAMDAAALKQAVAQAGLLRASTKIAWVADPTLRAAQYSLLWDGAAWKLIEVRTGKALSAGAKFTALQVTSLLPKGAPLMVQLPPSTELASALQNKPEDPLQVAETSDAANYLLLGTLGKDGLQYAWVRKDVLAQGVTVEGAEANQTLCSGNNPYPIRTDWSGDGASLHKASLQLARIFVWLTLPKPPTVDANFPYRLQLVDAAQQKPIVDEHHQVPLDALWRIALTSDHDLGDALPPQRSIYVIGINCQGRGQLLVGNDKVYQFPGEGRNDQSITLDPAATTFSLSDPPYGLETLILLAVSQPLEDPAVMNFESVLTQTAPRGDRSPLERLLGSASTGRRGEPAPLPTDWMVDYLQVSPRLKSDVPGQPADTPAEKH